MTTRTSTNTDTDAKQGHAPVAMPVPALTILHHADERWTGARCMVGPTPFVLGRTSSVFGASALDHSRISRDHVRVTVEGTSLVVEDLGSRNGTWLNGVRTQRAVATAGDILEIGAVLLLFHFVPSVYTVRTSSRLLGKSAAMGQVLDAIHMVAPHATTVLVHGETGTGKELVAREIHEQSGRRGTFVGTNCGSLQAGVLESTLFGHERGAFSGAVAEHRGLFETAHGGTLLLDEIGDASPELQVALLRVLQEREVRRLGGTKTISIDTRVVAATHQDLEQLVSEGRFREDLFARLTAWVIEIPPLRSRCEDIPALAAEILRRHGEKRRLHRSAVLALTRAQYPRNVRQLEAALERVVRSAEPGDGELRIPESALPLLSTSSSSQPAPPVARDSQPPASARGAQQLVARDKASLERLLQQHGGNVTRAARELGIGRNTLYRWLREASVSLDATRGHE